MNSFLNQWEIYICPRWLYIWWSEPPLSQICTPYTYIFWTIWLIHLLTLEESYRRIGLAFNVDLPFNLSFDRAILKNLSYWLGLQTLVKGVPVSADAVLLSDIIITASCRGPQDLLFAIAFIAQIFMAASSSMAFQPSLLCFRELLSLLARLHGYLHVGLRCILEIEIRRIWIRTSP